jgi:hypothetical protein
VWIAVGGASATITVSCAIGVAVSHGAIDVADDDVADDDVARMGAGRCAACRVFAPPPIWRSARAARERASHCVDRTADRRGQLCGWSAIVRSSRNTLEITCFRVLTSLGFGRILPIAHVRKTIATLRARLACRLRSRRYY